MEENEHIDKIFREQLDGQRHSIDPDFLKDLNQRLDATAKAPAMSWWLDPLMILVLIGSLFFLPTSQRLLTNTSDGEISQIQPVKSDSAISSEIQANKQQDLSAAQTHNVNKTKNVGTSGNRSNQINGSKAAKNSKSGINSKTANNSKSADKSDGAVPPVFTGKNDKVANRDSYRDKKNATNSKQSSGISDNNPTTEPSLITKEKDSNTGNKNVTETDKIAHLEPKPIMSETNPISLNSKKPLAKEKSKPFSFGMQVYGGLNIYDPKIKSEGPDIIIGEEKYRNMLELGLNGNISYNAWRATSGFQYQRRQEVFLFTSLEISSYDSNYVELVTTPVYDSTGTVILYYDSVPTQMTTTIYDTVTNSILNQHKFSILTIPLYLAYEMKVGNWSIIPELGMNFNFALSDKPSYSYGSKISTAGDFRNFYMDGQLALELRKYFNQYHVFLKPNYRFGFSPYFSDDFQSRTLRSFGCQFGVGITFK